MSDEVSTAIDRIRSALSPDVEQQRLQALGDAVWTREQRAYDDVVKLATAICGSPISLISLVSKKNQYFKARTGVMISSTPRQESICQYTLTLSLNEFLVVPDTLLDPKFCNLPLVTSPPHIRFYLGFPLIKGGYNLGAVCIIDTQPRSLTPEQIDALKLLRNHIADWLVIPETPWWMKLWRNIFSSKHEPGWCA
jgi:GAF domain-containing protein